MYYSYDLQANALYLGLAPEKAATTHQVDEGTLVDVDTNGRIVGIEVINPDRDWPLDQICDTYGLEPQQRQLAEALRPEPPATQTRAIFMTHSAPDRESPFWLLHSVSGVKGTEQAPVSPIR